MAVALVQGGNDRQTNTTQVVSITYTAGNTIVFGISYENPTDKVTSVVGSVNGAYTELGTPEEAEFCVTHLYYKTGVTGTSENVTVTYSSSEAGAVTWTEWSGVDTGSPTGGVANGEQITGTGDITSGSLDVAGSAGDAVVAVMGNYYNCSTVAVGATNPSGFAIATAATAAGADGAGNSATGYAILAGSYGGACSMDPSTTLSTYGQIRVVVLKAGSAPAGPTLSWMPVSRVVQGQPWKAVSSGMTPSSDPD